jgi:hypothetical protein
MNRLAVMSQRVTATKRGTEKSPVRKTTLRFADTTFPVSLKIALRFSDLRFRYRLEFLKARFWARTMILAKSTSKADVMRNNVSKLGLCTFCSTNAIVCRANPAFRAIWPSENFCFSRCSFKMSAT